MEMKRKGEENKTDEYILEKKNCPNNFELLITYMSNAAA